MTRSASFLGFALAAPLAFAGLASAEPVSYGSLAHHPELPGVLFLTGAIKSNDSFELRRAMRDQKVELVVTASPGGNLYEGLQIAAILHDNGIGTYIPEGASCESACAKVFLGGVNRLVVGELGVHQFYRGDPSATNAAPQNVTSAQTQYTTADIIGIMNQFDTPPFVYEKMFGTSDIYYFKGSEKPRLNRGIDEEAFAEKVAAVDGFLESRPALLTRPAAQQPSPGATAAAPPEPAGVQPGSGALKRMSDIDFFGMDLSASGFRDVSIAECDGICRANPRCAAWSYVIATRWCWPKSAVQNISYAEGTVSQVVNVMAVAPGIFDRPFVEATAKDVVGYDIFPKGLRNTTLEQCRNACEFSPTCRAFSWVADRNWCFPKYGVGAVRTEFGVISGFKRDE